ncbi:amino acid ABC transporter permease [Nocardioides agariphilus]|uniref:Amino acid ABC transporter permease n=1 Tax=Nocardioides agariphilus TaxID=433664 RepID=A0A930VR41_9ACTN|nr:amino acid ABC transporter permease [Nocardioides agariphilus]MBF4769340.1 amino acid ABC transporter permease [Nocardioides agariphilus]
MASDRVVTPARPLDPAELEALPSGTLRQRLGDLRRDSRASSTFALGLGAVSVFLVVVGGLAVMVTGGLWDYESVVRSLTSARLATLAWAAIALGAAGLIVGCSVFRRVDTSAARSTAIAGAVLGVIGLVLGLGVYVFTRGDMDTFSRNFLNFSDVRDYFGAFVTGGRNTLILAGSAIVFGVLIGLPVSLLLLSQHVVVRAPARAYVNVIRGTPVLLQLSMVYFGISLGLGLNWSAYVSLIFGLSINAGAYSAEVFRAGLQSIEKGQLEAARGLGLSRMKAMRLVVVPQAVRRVIPPLLNEFIGLIKDTSLIAFLGVSLAERDVFAVASTGYSQYYNASFFVAAGVGYLIITLPLIGGVNALERRMRTGLVGIA